MPRLITNTNKPYTTSLTRICQYCSRELNAKGHSNHERACKIRLDDARRNEAYEVRLAAGAAEETRGHHSGSSHNQNMQNEPLDVDFDDGAVRGDYEGHGHIVQDHQIRDAGMLNATDNGPVPRTILDAHASEYRIDDIKVEYHPNSGRKPVIYHFEDYKRQKSSHNIPLDEEPWRPFACRADFEFAHVAMEAALSPVLVNTLIKLIHDVALGMPFTLSGERDLSRIWKMASDKLTPFKKEVIEVPYKGETRKYPVWFRPLWDWTVDLLKDSRVAPHIVWDAERLYKYNGSSFVRFFDEPWTGNRFWNVQNGLTEGKPLCWIIYADKNKLSTFGTEQGYPVIARCANLPTEIRNGDDVGGGRVIGWLPIVKDHSISRNKVTWTNHKRAVWHMAIRKILESIALISETGNWYDCADGVRRKICPCVLILSADYEEQTFMTLTRGVKGLFPCPRCLVPSDAQADLTHSAELRNQADTINLFNSLVNSTKADIEDKLKGKGLRNVKNAFWEIKNSDPYEAVSWDRLHSYSTGIFGDHMWSDFKLLFKEIGRSAEGSIDHQFDLIPRFSGLHHFHEVIPICFNDGSKFESLGKQLLFAAHNVLTPKKSRHGYILLQCLRVFLILDTYLSFEVHTIETIEAGRQELARFSKLISAYVKAIPPNSEFNFTVNWNFIKMHLQKHAFDDIEAKGVTRNYNTKPNEKLHKPLRNAYRLRTNFKNVAEQILRADHYLLVSALIRNKIEELDEKLAADMSEEHIELALEENEDARPSRQYYIGSGKKSQYFSQIEETNSDDLAYKDFRKGLAKHLNEFFLAHSIPLPAGRPISIKAYDQIKNYKLLKVNYENMVTCTESTDILRCNANFHNRPRFDSVIFRTANNGYVFGRLICLTGYTIDGHEYHTALVQPCDAPLGRPRRKDIDLGLMRVKAKPRSSPEFIPVSSIVRGAVLVPDFDKGNEYIVLDVLDSDMFLRVRNIQQATYR